MGLFSRKSKKEKLQDKYRKLLEQAHKLSTTNRRESDSIRAQAEEVLKEIEALP